MLCNIISLSAVLVSCLSIVTFADEIQSPLRHSHPHDAHSKPKVKKIAIVGAGAGGSSAAYFLNQFVESSGYDTPVEITIFDSNTYIGGRTTTVNAFEDENYPVELGASIFVKINHILYNATRDFGLSTAAKIYQAADDSKYDLGIWDGTEFVYKAESDGDDDDGGGNKSSWRGWWDIAKLLWKYGLAPIKTQRATKTAVGKFLEFYNEPWFPFTSLQDVVHRSGLVQYTNTSGRDLLTQLGVGELFTREIIQASTRVNYASNLGSIHGLETLVCMAIEGAVAVDGGNWQIFAEMAKTSAHRIFLNTTVTDIIKDTETGIFQLQTTNRLFHEISHKYNEFDTVILAAPYQFASIAFSPPLASPPQEIPYNSKYVTLFTSPRRLSPAFFGLDSPADVPSSVLTTLTESLNDKLGSQHGRDAVGPTGFWSISTLRVLFTNPISPEPQYLYKIFSAAPLTATFVARLFDIPYQHSAASPDHDHDPITNLPQSELTWSYEKTWHAYPYETPTATFENFTLSLASDEPDRHDGSSGLWYTSGIESFISTMETSALAGRNVARLIVDRWNLEAEAEAKAKAKAAVEAGSQGLS